MNRAIRNIAALTWAALALGLSPLWAQKAKSQKELQAITAVQVAKTPDERIAAIEKVLTDYADTEFKAALLQMAVQAEEQKNDYAQTVFYADRLLKVDPMNAYAMVTLASETARHTRENDLDKDEQLNKVDKWAKDGIEAAKVLPKIRPDIPDADPGRERPRFYPPAIIRVSDPEVPLHGPDQHGDLAAPRMSDRITYHLIDHFCQMRVLPIAQDLVAIVQPQGD